MKVDFSVKEKEIKDKIEEYLKILKKIYEEEKILVQQMKENIEIIEFLELPKTSKNLKNRLDIAQKNIYDVCRAYRITLKKNSIQ